MSETITYIAAPSDSRCTWWSLIIPEGQELNDSPINAPYLKKGADLELLPGQMLIDSEAVHHRKSRGFQTLLIVACPDGDWYSIAPTAARKAYIKANGGQDLMHESGDVKACLRMAIWLRRQPDLMVAFKALEKVGG